MDEEPYIDIEIDGEKQRWSVEAAESLVAAMKLNDEHDAALGRMCKSFAAMDARIDALFEPLLGCSRGQVACITVENISARCSQLDRLLRLEARLEDEEPAIPPHFVNWVMKLLERAQSELAPQRNRSIHDAWSGSLNPDNPQMRRKNRQARLGKKPPHGAAPVKFDVEETVSADDLDILEQKITTVSFALRAAREYLHDWRRTGEPPQLPEQWLQACVKHHLGQFQGWNPEEHQAPPPPYAYEHHPLAKGE